MRDCCIHCHFLEGAADRFVSAIVSKNARIYGPYPDSTKSPAALAAQNLARAAAGKQPIPPTPNAHTTAQLVPTQPPGSRATPASDTDDSPEPPYVGMPQPDDVTQPYKDGRIRNPVPSKLKGMTSNASGRFGVMHMDIKGKDLATERDAAAKRTSESTAKAAKMAFQNGYQAHRKSNWMRIPEETPDPSVPFTGTTPYNHALYGLKQPTPNPPKERPETFSRPLDPKETKEEQARLLTLLRTLQPVAVVDQLCKALAYFGGVPEAPPPQDGRFPESAEANGSGSVFVGWVAEIFPNIDAQGRPRPRPFRALEPSPAQAVEKRGRGRPKGSKASKFRSDKGVKKGPKKTMASEDMEVEGADNDGSWVDVEDTMMGNDQDLVITGEQARQTPEPPVSGEVETASAKKRGRPKGSKNKAKDGGAVPETDLNANPKPISALFSIGKKGGRPKGSKTRPRDAPVSSSSTPANADPAPSQPHVMTTQNNTAVPETQQQADPEFALAALKAFNESHATDIATQASSFQPVNVTASQVPGKKAGTVKGSEKAQPARKRKRNAKNNEAAPNLMATGVIAGTIGTAASTPALPSVNGAPGIPAANTIAPATPAPKRQRKSTKAKTATNTAAISAPVADLSVAGGPSQVSQTPVPPTPVTQFTDTQVYTSPTIEELEAQLEQHDGRRIGSPKVTTMKAPSRQPQTTHSTPPQPQVLQPQAHQSQQPKTVHTGQQMSDQQQRQAVLARQRQQYHQQQQQQTQQAVARTASPSVSHIGTTSPHLSVQSTSPNINRTNSVSPSHHQQRPTDSQTLTSATSHAQGQQPRSSQSYYAQQAPSSQSQYSQQQPQQYSNSQSKQHLSVQQPQQQQIYPSSQSSQQQPGYTAPQQQSSYPPQSKQQSYPAQQSKQQYSPQQQQYSSQQRISQQQYNTTSAGTTSQAITSQSPQYGSSAPPAYNSGDGTFRASSSTGINFATSSYASNHASNASRTNNVYPTSAANSYGSPNQQQQLSSYATSRRPLPTSTSQPPPVPNVQSLPQNIGSFSDFGNLGFDIASLDNAATGNGGLGLNAAPYNIGTGNVSRPSAGAGNFTSLSSFDSTLRHDGNSYYGLPHRR